MCIGVDDVLVDVAGAGARQHNGGSGARKRPGVVRRNVDRRYVDSGDESDDGIGWGGSESR